MENLNLFSYVQHCSVFFNILKYKEKLGKVNQEQILQELDLSYLKPVSKDLTRMKMEKGELKDTCCLEEMVKISKEQAKYTLEKCRKRLDKWKEALVQLDFKLEYLEAELMERGLFGASQHFGKVLFEVGLEFDPYLNVPIVPGSSIKGALASVYDLIQEDGWPEKTDIFGDEKVGKIICLDALPVKPGRNGMILYPDVLTPHYTENGEDQPEEWDEERNEPREPRPVSYLSVAPHTIFGFVFGLRRDAKPEIFRKIVETAFDLGIGAKTSVGYGRFRIVGGEVHG